MSTCRPHRFRPVLALFCALFVLAHAPVATAAAPASPDARAQYQRAVDFLAGGSQLAALDLLEKAAMQGEYRARLLLTNRYAAHAWKLDRNEFAQHLEQLRKAADGGDAASATMLGLALQYGAGEAGADKIQARNWYEKAAAAGNTAAMVFLGQLFESDGAPEIGKDTAKAMGWYRKAVAANDAQAMYKLAGLYAMDSDELKKNTAAELQRNAADLGFVPAILKMAQCKDAECQDYAQRALREGSPDGVAYQLFYGPRPATEYAAVKQICQQEELYFQQQKEIFQYAASEPGRANTESLLGKCVLDFGYLPAIRTRPWMLTAKDSRYDLEKMFKLEDFDERAYPFTHKMRAEKSYEIVRALEQVPEMSAFEYRCGEQLFDFPDSYDDLQNPSGARNNWSKAFSIASNFNNCVRNFSSSAEQRPIEKLVPVYSLLTNPEKLRAIDNYKKGVDAIKDAIARGRTIIDREMSRVEQSQGRMQAAAEASRRAAVENRKWMQDIAQSLNDIAERLRPPPPPQPVIIVSDDADRSDRGRNNASGSSGGIDSARPSRTESVSRLVLPGADKAGTSAQPRKTCYYYAKVSGFYRRKIYQVADTVILLDVISAPQGTFDLALENAARDFVKAHHRELGIDPAISNSNIGMTEKCNEADTHKERQMELHRLEDRLKYKLDSEWMDYLMILHGDWFPKKN
ncbi:hypothetical protein [Herbaspirillum sp.]|uniref:tetratricopeptide repeat protein n=1 Tax=Herbaspirillum sp. TaxID=1890675 RepID=UPI001B0015F8|nr:hypothetical protein [Herbaspirillum sp.]MBO9538065.1 sel1 repeat family protein [Herbaspirillum sp.]